jgi:hypothetical protein
MTTTHGPVRYTIHLLIRDWLLIDGTMDNHVQSAIDGAVPDAPPGGHTGNETDLDDELSQLPRVARLGSSIRRAGWEQIPGWPHDLEGFKTWPAPGQTATMSLTAGQWNLVVAALRHWADVDEQLSDVEGAARSRAIAATVAQRLAEQGCPLEAP